MSETIAGNRRRWFVVVALVGIPLVLLLGLECLLRVAGFGYDPDFFLKRQVEGRPAWIDNQDFGKRFFPSGLVRYPHPTAFAAGKAQDTVRVFVLGESAAMGDPDAKFGLPRMLEVLLQERYPGRKIEVVNASMVAINSHVILPIARECARRDGDLWVIYMGNNEVIGPWGAVTPFGGQAPALPLIRANLAIKKWRVGQLIDRALRWARPSGETPVEWGGMTMWAEHRARATDPSVLRVHESFRRNLSDILAAGRQAGVPMLLCTVATNLKDCAPFGSLHAPGLSPTQQSQWESAYQEGRALEAQGQFERALVSYRQALALDEQFAELSFAIGRCHLALGQPQEAARHFRNARDQDALQFRTDSRINAMIRQTAAELAGAGVQLLDAEHLFATNAPGGGPGLEYFYEHVHLNPEGNYLLARTVAERVATVLDLDTETRSAPDPSARATAAGPPKPWLTGPECLQALGFTDWNRYDILSRMLVERVDQPPFTSQINHNDHIAALRRQMEEHRAAAKPAQLRRAAAQVTQAAARRPNDPDLRWNLAQLLDLSDDVAKAEEAWRTVIRMLPHANLPYHNLARLQENQGRTAEARQLYEQSLKLQPDAFETRHSLGLLLVREGRFQDAADHLAHAVRLRPSSPAVRLDLAMTLQRANRIADATRQFREVLRLQPDNSQARQALGNDIR